MKKQPRKGIIGNPKAQAELLKWPNGRLFALLCKAGHTKEACKIVQDGQKERSRDGQADIGS